jgi:hypothetical protein
MRLIADPTLLDFLIVCPLMRGCECAHVEAVHGKPFNADHMAVFCYGLDGPKWSIVDGADTPVAICGFVPRRPGVWEIWMIATDYAWRRPVEMTRICRFLIRGMFAQGARRLEHIALDGYPAITAWYRSIWLKFEGKMPAWGAKGEDALIFACTEISNAHPSEK